VWGCKEESGTKLQGLGAILGAHTIVICKSVARSAFFRNLADPAAPSNPGARTPNSLPKPPKER
jgi:hypothetical protein